MRRRRDQDAAYAEFVRTHRGSLVTTARLLAGGDAHLGEDLVQTALVRVYLAWGRVRTEPAAYARRVLVNASIDHRRRPFVRREQVTDDLPDRRAPDGADRLGGALDAELVAALADLPARMRAAVVLRHVHDLSVEETAEVLACAPGTVKSQTARGLEKLRRQLHDHQLLRPATTSAVPTPTGDRP